MIIILFPLPLSYPILYTASKVFSHNAAKEQFTDLYRLPEIENQIATPFGLAMTMQKKPTCAVGTLMNASRSHALRGNQNKQPAFSGPSRNDRKRTAALLRMAHKTASER